MSSPAVTAAIHVAGFEPENDLERAVTADPRLLVGLAWGRPRRGHPEGAVGNHVADLLRTTDEWGETGRRRSDLRFIALVHDSFKYAVSPLRPRTGENHHAMRARRFAEDYTSEERLLAVIELHDRPYHLWRRHRRTGHVPDRKGDDMIARLPDLSLFVRFVELDASTEGKRPEPVEWLENELRKRELA
ncbi:MAG: hypothetical protein JW895_18255 [Thermoleophilaceae bacterium]|nr:hypothetical protein [Thermoleophilaceae bacterium]